MKDKIIVTIFITILFSFFLFQFISKDQDISVMERRKLTTISAVKEDFTTNLDSYLTDQFPFRNQLLIANSFLQRFILHNKEFNNVYLKDDYIIDKMYPLDEKSIQNFITKLNDIKEQYLTDSNCFYAIIPDKSYFLDKNNYLVVDYAYMINQLNKNIHIPYINISDLLELDDYYKTDIHIKQESYFKIIQKLSNYLDFAYQDIEYEKNVYKGFQGASYYKVPSSKAENLNYLVNDIIEDAKVKHLEYNEDTVYQVDALDSNDAYNIFLRGPSSFIEIENTHTDNTKELIIFRDSFGSSLAPLLIPYYKKITLIDLRYCTMNQIKDYLDFSNKDVLFLYSTLIVNNSYLLKG